MSLANAHTDSQGQLSRAGTPGIRVRADKNFLCTACGETVEIPAEVVGKMVVVPEPVEQILAEDPSPAATPVLTGPPRPQRLKQPKQDRPAERRIDGLKVPAAAEMERALAWVSFHLKLLGLQGTEVNRLKKRFKKRRLQQPQAHRGAHWSEGHPGSKKRQSVPPVPRPGRHAKKAPVRKRNALPIRALAGQRMTPTVKPVRSKVPGAAPTIRNRYRRRRGKSSKGRGPP
ncbi:hypothetical protein [Bremerella alba]|uniref:Uncharacterized protein n=1 Tax=Bremerella alba TaxID=980252 RepID=A0A7V9A8I3_9BACT|nr:hypothetical protein [Bremerella alba]MBA2116525.1 hypothetical protein [Bremerella alba]